MTHSVDMVPSPFSGSFIRFVTIDGVGALHSIGAFKLLGSFASCGALQVSDSLGSNGTLLFFGSFIDLGAL